MKKSNIFSKAKICYIAKFSQEKIFYKKIKDYLNDENCDVIELRIDSIFEKTKNLDKTIEIINNCSKQIKHKKKYAIATFRTKQDGSNIQLNKYEYLYIIKRIYNETDIDIIDIEYRHYEELTKEFDEFLTTEKKIILSFHDFKNHYNKQKINKLLSDITKCNKDIVKIAIFTHKKQEVLDLMEVSKDFEKKSKKNIFFVIIAMGQIGLVSRIYNEYTKTKIIYIDNDAKKIGPIGNINIKKYKELREKLKELK